MKWNKVLPSGTPTIAYILTRDGGGIVYQGINTSFTETDLIDGYSYNYQIRALNLEGNGPISAIQVGYAGEKPSQPHNFKIVL